MDIFGMDDRSKGLIHNGEQEETYEKEVCEGEADEISASDDNVYRGCRGKSKLGGSI